jgi:hypothetical protein
MRKIDVRGFKPIEADIRGVGPAPQLQWLPIAALRVDDGYQRPIRAEGQQHIRRIAAGFDWRLFAPVLVAPIEGGHYAVIDGQHRCHGAALRGIEQVPCQVIVADQAQQARAFAAINGRQAIKLAAYQIHRAALAAGNPKAKAVERVLEQAGARISNNKSADKMERGETVAVATIYNMIAAEGETVAIAAIEAICKAGDGNAGLLNALALTAYASLFKARPDLREHDGLLDALDDFDLREAVESARRWSAKSAEQRQALRTALEAYLDGALAIAAPPASSLASIEPRLATPSPQGASNG